MLWEVTDKKTFKYRLIRRCWYSNYDGRRIFFIEELTKISLGGIRTTRDLGSKALRCGGDANYYSFEWRKSKGNVILPVILKFCGPSISQKEISKQKQKYCSYLFVQIRWEEARDYVNVIKIHSLPEPAAGPKILEFSCTQKESVFCVFVAVMSLVKILVFYRCHFYYFFYTWKINIQRAEERWRGSGKPALAFENVDFVDDVVIFVIVRINETRKVLYVKVLPRYYINK